MGMSKLFTYVGGPRDQETEQADEIDFPEVHPGGEYRLAGFSHSAGSTGSGSPLPETSGEKENVIWYPSSEPSQRG